MFSRSVSVSVLLLVLWSCSSAAPVSAATPTEVGQSAFAAIAEIRALLLADSETDWSRVDFLALRDHLVDMNLVALSSRVIEEEIENGVRMTVRAEGRALGALQRMVPMHVHTMGSEESWQVAVRHLVDGFVVDLTGSAEEAPRLRGLGFFGFLAAGDHHQRHHLAIARGAGHGGAGGHDHAKMKH